MITGFFVGFFLLLIGSLIVARQKKGVCNTICTRYNIYLREQVILRKKNASNLNLRQNRFYFSILLTVKVTYLKWARWRIQPIRSRKKRRNMQYQMDSYLAQIWNNCSKQYISELHARSGRSGSNHVLLYISNTSRPCFVYFLAMVHAQESDLIIFGRFFLLEWAGDLSAFETFCPYLSPLRRTATQLWQCNVAAPLM